MELILSLLSSPWAATAPKCNNVTGWDSHKLSNKKKIDKGDAQPGRKKKLRENPSCKGGKISIAESEDSYGKASKSKGSQMVL